MKWKKEAPGMCCPPDEAGHWSLSSIDIKEMCLSACLSVGAFLKDGESDLDRIWLAHAEFINVESETVVAFLTSPTPTPFPPIALASARARISPERQIVSPPNLDCPFPTLDGTRRACRLLRATPANGRYFC